MLALRTRLARGLPLLLVAAGGAVAVGSAGAGAPMGPDLVDRPGKPATASSAGASFRVADTAVNRGRRTAKAATTRYYLSLDRKKGRGDVRVGSRRVPKLKAGKSSKGGATARVPQVLPAGAYHLLACADDARKVKETNEGNNCGASRGKVQIVSQPGPAPVPGVGGSSGAGESGGGSGAGESGGGSGGAQGGDGSVGGPGAGAGDADADGTPDVSDCAPNDGAVHPGAADAPEPLFRDTNCDGIDGDQAGAVFVSAAGDDANPGTRSQPKRTVEAANVLAGASAPKKDVYVAAGSYAETLVVRDGVGVYGAYSGLDWSRAPSNTTAITQTTVTGGRVEAALAQNVAGPTELQYLALMAGPTNSPGASTYGLRVLNSPGLILDHLTVSAGNAGAGVAGSNGVSGAAGTAGGQGGAGSCDNENAPGLGGTQGGGPAGRLGGVGGTGGQGPSNGMNGGAGVGGTPGGIGGADDDPGWPGQNGANGAFGAPGPNGSGGSGGSVVGNAWSPAGGVAGGVGTHGNGGGGGGGGGGQGGTWVDDGAGNGGGGGGGGGAAGSPGTGGTGGGGSFGLFLVNSSGATVRDSAVSSGNGGAGGAGGTGGTGGTGANGGTGGNACTTEVGRGGNGGRGGDGGRGGHGGGGAGGASYAVYRVNSSGVVPTATSLSHGSGGSGGSSPGNPGATGASGTLF